VIRGASYLAWTSISLRRKSRITYLESVGAKNVTFIPTGGPARPMGTQISGDFERLTGQ
jgi:hypothetical protein